MSPLLALTLTSEETGKEFEKALWWKPGCHQFIVISVCIHHSVLCNKILKLAVGISPSLQERNNPEKYNLPLK